MRHLPLVRGRIAQKERAKGPDLTQGWEGLFFPPASEKNIIIQGPSDREPGDCLREGGVRPRLQAALVLFDKSFRRIKLFPSNLSLSQNKAQEYLKNIFYNLFILMGEGLGERISRIFLRI